MLPIDGESLVQQPRAGQDAGAVAMAAVAVRLDRPAVPAQGLLHRGLDEEPTHACAPERRLNPHRGQGERVVRTRWDRGTAAREGGRRTEQAPARHLTVNAEHPAG